MLIQATETPTARARAVTKAKASKADSKVAATRINIRLNLKTRTWTNGAEVVVQASLKAVPGPVTLVGTLIAIMTLGLAKVAESRKESKRATKTMKTQMTSKI